MLIEINGNGLSCTLLLRKEYGTFINLKDAGPTGKLRVERLVHGAEEVARICHIWRFCLHLSKVTVKWVYMSVVITSILCFSNLQCY